MALEPYRPERDNRYRDELDRELDQKIDKFFDRWNWKLVRGLRRLAIVAFVIWVLINVIPSAYTFIQRAPLGPVILQVLSVAGYLFVFIGFQFFLMYFYAVDVQIPTQQLKLPLVFTADNDGKIVRITSPLNN